MSIEQLINRLDRTPLDPPAHQSLGRFLAYKMKPLDEYELAIALLGPLLPIDSEPMSEIFQRIKSHDNSLIGTRARILLSAASNEPFDGYALEYLLDWAEQLELERGDILARIETMIQSRSE